MNLVIEQRLAQAILDYLVQQPYREVAHFVAALQQLKQAAEPDADSPTAAA